MISRTNAAYNLAVSNSASGSIALKVMTMVAVIFFRSRSRRRHTAPVGEFANGLHKKSFAMIALKRPNSTQ